LNQYKALRHKNFYRELDQLLGRIDHTQGFETMLTELLEQVTVSFADLIGLDSARLYRDEGEGYVVLRSFGAKGSRILGFKVEKGYAVLRDIPPDQVAYFPPGDPRLDPALEQALGVDHFAAFLVGPTRDYIAAFGLSDDADVEEALLVLSTLRHAIDHRLRQEDLEGQLAEAKAIQVSLLPERAPTFEGFELAAMSVPADAVGGDIIDFLPLDENLMGLAVGDASGHGLPAALQARDVVTGLRMGVEKDLKITSVFRRLNRVIHRSGATSRFVSLFYGELERNGTFVYVNAGHDPGLLLRADGRRELLRSTGVVLGPMEDLHYRRSFVEIAPGDCLVLYTDGVCERQGPDGDFGLARMEEHLRLLLGRGTPVAELPAALLQEARRFGQDQAWADDVTVLVARRRRGRAGEAGRSL
jgi:sigma-B regulation protein RsbU (phosphoserine phosphatase)